MTLKMQLVNDIDERVIQVNEFYFYDDMNSIEEGPILNFMIKQYYDRSAKKINNYNVRGEDKEDKLYLANTCKKLTSIIKKIYNKMKNTSDFKNKCRKTADKFNKDADEYEYDLEKIKQNYIPNVSIRNYDDYIMVLDDHQYINTYYSWILYDIIKELKSNYKNINVEYDTGDGDEGCIYLTLSKEYILNKIKSQNVNENMTPGDIGSSYISGIKSQSNVYMIQYMQNNVFGNDTELSYGICDSPLLDNLIIRNKKGELVKAPEKFVEKCMDDFTLYSTNISVEEANEKLAPYMNDFVTEEFMYETLTGQKMYSFDQIPFTDGFEKEDRFDITINNIKSNLESYLLGGINNEF
jgi:hypothetical protein